MPLLIKTELRSCLGLFSSEFIQKGQIVWEHDAIFDGWIHANLIGHPKLAVFRKHIESYYSYDAEINSYIRTADNTKFIRHHNSPNLLAQTKYCYISARNIELGEELTIDHSEICDLSSLNEEIINLNNSDDKHNESKFPLPFQLGS